MIKLRIKEVGKINKEKANKIIQDIHEECKKNRECVECQFYIYDEENDLNGCISGEIDITEIGNYEL